jgi:hypothetical protein
MTSTAFALSQLPHELTFDTYVRQHVVFLYNQRKGGTSWLDVVLQRAMEHASVSDQERLILQSNTLFLGRPAPSSLEFVVCSWPSYDRLATGCTWRSWNAAR